MSILKSFAKSMVDYNNRESAGSKFRAKRLAPFLRLIETIYAQHGCVTIIDIGGTESYWGIVPQEFLHKNNVKITLVNLPSLPLPSNHGLFSFIHGDGCNLSEIEGNAYHLAHSNSVVEHVGDWRRMVQFSRECKRVARKHFIQTPNYWFPVEPHCVTPFFHWLPKPIRIYLVMNFALGNWRKAPTMGYALGLIEGSRLLNKKMFQVLFDDSRIITEWFYFLPKSFVAIRD